LVDSSLADAALRYDPPGVILLSALGRAPRARATVLALAILGLVPTLSATAQPWEYRCRSALSDVEDAASDAERARSLVEDAYERYKRAKEDYESCRRWERDCDWRRMEAESAKSNAESELDTFNSRLRSLLSDVDDVKTACAADSAEFSPVLRACRIVGLLKRRSEQEARDFCRKINFSDELCRRCMQP
jgi:hypothetical protein